MGQVRLGKLRARSSRATLGVVLSVIGLLILTAWNVTRSGVVLDARRAYTRGDLVLCLERALDHLDRQPWSREAALLAGRSLSRLDYADEAEPYFRRAGRLTQNDTQIRAYGLVRGPHAERAIPVYNELLARWPDNVIALRRLAAVQLSRDNTTESIKLADRLISIPSGAVIGHTIRGVVYHNDRNPQEAVAAFERVLALDPGLREMPLSRRLFWSHLADDLIECGRIDDAKHQLSSVLTEDSDPELMNRLGRVYFLQGSLEDAERCFRQAAEWGPIEFDPHLNLAKLAMQRKDPEGALTHLSEAKLRAPREYTVLYSLASVYRQLGRPDDAKRIQDALAQLREGSPTGRGDTVWPVYAL
jgi:tetratricopeptide (TPR) repeat protein